MAARIGMRGVTASRFVSADTGSHLSGNVQPGRCRVRSTWPRMSSKYSGARVGASESRITGSRRSNRSFALMRSALREPASGCSSPASSSVTRIARKRPVQPGLHGSEGDPQRDGDVGQRHPEVVVQDHDGAPLRRQLAQRAVDELALGNVGRRIANGRHGQGRELDFDGTTAAASRRVETGIHGEAMEPGVEPVRVAQPGQVLPGPHHRVLDGVPRELAVPEDESGGRVQPRDGHASQQREGVLVAPLRPTDEVTLVHGHSSVARPLGRARMLMAQRPAKRFPACSARAASRRDAAFSRDEARMRDASFSAQRASRLAVPERHMGTRAGLPARRRRAAMQVRPSGPAPGSPRGGPAGRRSGRSSAFRARCRTTGPRPWR